MWFNKQFPVALPGAKNTGSISEIHLHLTKEEATALLELMATEEPVPSVDPLREVFGALADMNDLGVLSD